MGGRMYLTCVNKIRKSGKHITEYELADIQDSSKRCVMASDKLKQSMALGLITVDNLKLTKDDRLVSCTKKVKNEESQNKVLIKQVRDLTQQVQGLNEALAREKGLHKQDVDKLNARIADLESQLERRKTQEVSYASNDKDVVQQLTFGERRVQIGTFTKVTLDNCLSIMFGFNDTTSWARNDTAFCIYKHKEELYDSYIVLVGYGEGIRKTLKPSAKNSESKKNGYIILHLSTLYKLGYKVEVQPNGVLDLGKGLSGESIISIDTAGNNERGLESALKDFKLVRRLYAPVHIEKIVHTTKKEFTNNEYTVTYCFDRFIRNK